jgi:hypothetical protein
MSMRLYTLGQVKGLLSQAQLRLEAVYGSRDGKAFGRASSRLVVLASR